MAPCQANYIHHSLDIPCKTTCCHFQRNSRDVLETLFYLTMRRMSVGDCFYIHSKLTTTQQGFADFLILSRGIWRKQQSVGSFQPEIKTNECQNGCKIKALFMNLPLVLLICLRSYPKCPWHRHHRLHRRRSHLALFPDCCCLTFVYEAKAYLWTFAFFVARLLL